MTQPVVRLDGLCKSFGGIVVAQDIHLALEAGRIVGLIGPNGAGKTSLFNLISGAVGADAGAIYLNGRLVNRLPMHARARLGLSRTWQNIRLFPSLTVLDNLIVAPRLYAGESIVKCLFAAGALGRQRATLAERAMAQLAKVRMTHAASRYPTEFSYGKQKLISLARALMNDGNGLLLDEPIAGVEGPAYDSLMEVIRGEAAAGRAVCVVEHNVSFVKDLCDWAVFMFQGRIVRTGTVADLVASEELTELYFGR
ncbi:MAG: ATP-binding cassette domain-containing protein [Proteobacteria bacterium]|nr:ATP-binding cassette domain-containing protein [Pseudomonadota bacterium]